MELKLCDFCFKKKKYNLKDICDLCFDNFSKENHGQYRCLRCNYRWTSFLLPPNFPIKCSKCRSPLWNIPRECTHCKIHCPAYHFKANYSKKLKVV